MCVSGVRWREGGSLNINRQSSGFRCVWNAADKSSKKHQVSLQAILSQLEDNVCVRTQTHVSLSPWMMSRPIHLQVAGITDNHVVRVRECIFGFVGKLLT